MAWVKELNTLTRRIKTMQRWAKVSTGVVAATNCFGFVVVTRRAVDQAIVRFATFFVIGLTRPTRVFAGSNVLGTGGTILSTLLDLCLAERVRSSTTHNHLLPVATLHGLND